MRTISIDRRLHHHLVLWLGRWPAHDPMDVVGSPRRTEPGWDGQIHPAVGVADPDCGVLSVPPDSVDVVRSVVEQAPTLLVEKLPTALDLPSWRAYRGVFRWTTGPTEMPESGVWLPVDDPALPDWLRPFGGDALVARDPDTGAYLAGVGVKRHNEFGQELSVGTVEAARGKGLARRLVAQAARRVLDEGGVPTYLHDPRNVASARVAEAAGFPERGWTVIEVVPGQPALT